MYALSLAWGNQMVSLLRFVQFLSVRCIQFSLHLSDLKSYSVNFVHCFCAGRMGDKKGFDLASFAAENECVFEFSTFAN